MPEASPALEAYTRQVAVQRAREVKNIVRDRFGFVSQDHHRGSQALVIALGLASLVNAEADQKTTFRRADLCLVKCVRTEKRVTGLKPYRVKELLLELAPAGRGHDDQGVRPIKKAPESGGNKDSRRLARAIAGGQGRRMAGLNVAKGLPLPLVRPNSKDALGELKDSEPGSGSIHADKFSFASDLSRIEPVLESSLEALEQLFFARWRLRPVWRRRYEPVGKSRWHSRN